MAVLLAALGAMALFPRAVDAQERVPVRGTVRDAHLGTPVADATIRLASPRLHTRSDSAGRFELQGVPPGSLRLRVERFGYAAAVVTIEASGTGDAGVVVALTPTPVPLDEVGARATARTPLAREFESRRARHHASGRFLTRSELARYEASTLANVLRSRLPGTHVVWDPVYSSSYLATGRQQPPGSMRRPPRPCFAQVFIDGVQVYGQTAMDGGAVRPPDLDSFLVQNLESLEYYGTVSATPVEFRTGTASCGTLALWTRQGP